MGCISFDGVGPLAKIDDRMKGKDYIDHRYCLLIYFHTCTQCDQNTLLWMTLPLAIEPVVSQWMYINNLKNMEV